MADKKRSMSLWSLEIGHQSEIGDIFPPFLPMYHLGPNHLPWAYLEMSPVATRLSPTVVRERELLPSRFEKVGVDGLQYYVVGIILNIVCLSEWYYWYYCTKVWREEVKEKGRGSFQATGHLAWQLPGLLLAIF